MTLSFERCRSEVRKAKFYDQDAYQNDAIRAARFLEISNKDKNRTPEEWPKDPHLKFKDSGWKGWQDFLGLVSNFSAAMQAMESAKSTEDRLIAKQYIANLFSFNGSSHLVRFTSLRGGLDEYTCDQHGFNLLCPPEREQTKPESWHIFYTKKDVQVRVKTKGTKHRPKPHMVVTLAIGKDFSEEVAKFDRSGELRAKLGFSNRPGIDHRSLMKAGSSTKEIMDKDDAWANAVHFDLPEPFNDEGAESLWEIRCPGRQW